MEAPVGGRGDHGARPCPAHTRDGQCTCRHGARGAFFLTPLAAQHVCRPTGAAVEYAHGAVATAGREEQAVGRETHAKRARALLAAELVAPDHAQRLKELRSQRCRRTHLSVGRRVVDGCPVAGSLQLVPGRLQLAPEHHRKVLAGRQCRGDRAHLDRRRQRRHAVLLASAVCLPEKTCQSLSGKSTQLRLALSVSQRSVPFDGRSRKQHWLGVLLLAGRTRGAVLFVLVQHLQSALAHSGDARILLIAEILLRVHGRFCVANRVRQFRPSPKSDSTSTL